MEHEEGVEKVPLAAPLPEVKRFHLNKWHALTIALIVIIGIQLVLYLSLTMRYDLLNSDHRALISEHQNLNNNYTTLQGNHSSLQSSYNLLESSHSSLQSSYDSLQSSYDSYVSDYSNLRNEVNQRTMQLGVKDFITPEDSTVKSKVLQITGGWSNPSDWNEFWGDAEKMYDWVVNNIEYRSDGLSPVLPSKPSGSIEYCAEMWQFPKETLNLTKGDCEDMAILLTSMITFYGGTKFVGAECISITSSTSGHAGVQMPVTGDKLTILDPAGKYYTQTSGNIDQKDISTEINNWLNYWKPQIGSDVYVERVFSDDLDKSFSSTSEYTSWMYNR